MLANERDLDAAAEVLTHLAQAAQLLEHVAKRWDTTGDLANAHQWRQLAHAVDGVSITIAERLTASPLDGTIIPKLLHHLLAQLER